MNKVLFLLCSIFLVQPNAEGGSRWYVREDSAAINDGIYRINVYSEIQLAPVTLEKGGLDRSLYGELPVAACKNLTISLGPKGEVAITPADIDNGSSAGCGLSSIVVSPNKFDCSHIGTPQIVTLTVTDYNGQSSTCESTVTVVDNTPPVITGPGIMTIAAAPGEDFAIARWTPPTAFDNCGTPVIVQTTGPANGSSIPVGTTFYCILRATDAAGNVAYDFFTVTAESRHYKPYDILFPPGFEYNGEEYYEEPYFISYPSNITVPALIGTDYAIVNWPLPTATFIRSSAVTTQIQGPPSGSAFPVGTTLIQYLAESPGYTNTTAICAFTITVTNGENPVFTFCPSGIIVRPTEPGTASAVVNWPTPVAVDDDGPLSVVQTTGPTNNSILPIIDFPLPIHVTYTATDASGNKATCYFEVKAVDAEKPVFNTCPSDTIVYLLNPSATETVVSWPTVTATDNCSVPRVIQIMGPASGSTLNVGNAYLVQYEATDKAGNLATCEFRIDLTKIGNPVFYQCPDNITIVTPVNSCSTPVSWPPVTAGDGDGPTTVEQISGLTNGSEFPIGNTFVSFRATDPLGNYRDCSFMVTVQDLQPPVRNPADFNVTLASAPDSCSTYFISPFTHMWFDDNCVSSGPGTYVTTGLGYGQFPYFPVGVTPALFRFSDLSLNINDILFLITVKDTTSPEFSSCPGNLAVSAALGECSAIVEWSDPIAIDNCSQSIVRQTHGPTPGSTFSIGTTHVVYKAIDASTNEATCYFTVTVNDNEPPAAVCADQTLTFNGESSFSLDVGDLVVVSDNCGIQSIALSTAQVTPGQIGQIIPVTVTVEDTHCNISTCTSYITVKGLPGGWSQNPDGIGCPGGNSVEYYPANGEWTITSNNCFNDGNFSSDCMAFVQHTLCGDGSITAKVKNISGALGWAGVVMRETNAPGAKKAHLMSNLSSF
ncbi:MAG: HYR domain-containing protein [Saprospiraceae bacterium]|nr:HYR domain-containing protein [Saprospiraceae bacterium]